MVYPFCFNSNQVYDWLQILKARVTKRPHQNNFAGRWHVVPVIRTGVTPLPVKSQGLSLVTPSLLWNHPSYTTVIQSSLRSQEMRRLWSHAFSASRILCETIVTFLSISILIYFTRKFRNKSKSFFLYFFIKVENLCISNSKKEAFELSLGDGRWWSIWMITTIQKFHDRFELRYSKNSWHWNTIDSGTSITIDSLILINSTQNQAQLFFMKISLG